MDKEIALSALSLDPLTLLQIALRAKLRLVRQPWLGIATPPEGGSLKSPMLFLQEVLNDLGTWCGTSTILDFKTVQERFEHEGWSFLTITLSNFGSDFQDCLELGFVGDDHFCGFRRTGGLPTFMSGFLRLVFDRSTGRLLDSPSVTAIWAIRQFTLMWSKINLKCTPAREAAAITRYIECEEEVRYAEQSLDSRRDLLESFRRIGVLLWSDVFSSADLAVYRGDILPGHGPGHTADKLVGNHKWNQQEWPERLHTVFPYWEYLCASWSLSQDRLQEVSLLTPEQERPVKVTLVPKTLKTPRIIAQEPTCMMYVQQGLRHALEEAIEVDSLAGSFISSRSQVPNQELARKGSLTGELATLDLSEASDRVSNRHVIELLRNHPHLREAVAAARSTKADVPGHGVIPLSKFASMGSALCFTFESMVFMTIVFAAIEQERKRPFTRKSLLAFVGSVRVYGDDIIVPVEFVPAVVETLEAFGFKVNSRKSFWTGKFRESCGRDYYGGVDVSIVKLRSVLPTRQTHASEIVSTVSTRNQLYFAGMWKSARYLDSLLEKLIAFPSVGPDSPVLGRHSFLGPDLSDPGIRMHPHLQVPIIKGFVEDSRPPPSRVDDYAALTKCLLKRGDLPIPDSKHLERAGRPKTVRIKLRWSVLA